MEINELNTIDMTMERMGYSQDDIYLVKKAYTYAYNLHKGQFRNSGEPYISHPLAVFYILLEMKADRDTLCAGLLHDTIEDTNITKKDIAQLFNENVANLVDGVTKLKRMNFSSKQAQNLANTRKIITSINNDVRIIIIKLADRLHNMRTLQFKKREKQIENSLETLELFVPLAYRIGAYRIKSELEDLAFRYLKPDIYQDILMRKMRLSESNNSCMIETSERITEILEDRNIYPEIKMRTKNIYGIYNYLERGYEKLEDIHDLLSLKIMVKNLENCYQSLGIIHSKYHSLNDELKDYICNPKNNNYQSIHTTIFGESDRLVQTQIRTFEMDRIASFGLTAYWDINQVKAKDLMQEELKKTPIYKNLVEINRAYPDNQEFINQVKMELFTTNVYVYTPKGEIIELPSGSTPIDFAYRIHTDIGNKMIAAIVNGRLVPVNYKLQNKDKVKIITGKDQQYPNEEWVDIAYTTYAKRRIKEYK